MARVCFQSTVAALAAVSANVIIMEQENARNLLDRIMDSSLIEAARIDRMIVNRKMPVELSGLQHKSQRTERDFHPQGPDILAAS